MKLLVTCDRYPDARQDGLSLRLQQLLAPLRGRVHAELLYLDRSGRPEGAAQAPVLQPLFQRIERLPSAGLDPRPGRWASFFDPEAAYPRGAALSAALAAALQRLQPDVVLDAAANLGAVLVPALAQRPTPWVADQVDDSNLRLRREQAHAPHWRQALRLRWHAHHEALHARQMLARADRVLLATDDDAASFRASAPQARIAVVANGVDTSHFAPGAVAAHPAVDLVFEGSMDFAPNVDAARFLVHEVLPRLRALRPGATLALVGREPAPAVRALAGDGVTVTGTVDDVRPWLAAGRVFACPMRLGAGIKNKVLQAMAMGRPVVATSAALAGTPAQHGQTLLRADGAAALADACAALLGDEARARTLGEAARAAVLAAGSWSSQAERLWTVLQQVASEGPHARTRA